ncbi:hypothetical protein QUB28_28055 [Microcoleus sp. B4-C3]|uniref:hypothetical protein n=1 Tax=Microcoleus sp. B4-C2 TaxID=2818661 RepID=UPI002FD4433F
MPVPQDSFLVVEEQARCLFHKTVFWLWKNRQDACSTKNFCYCGTGILPVIVEEQARCLFHKKFFVIVEEQARCLFHKKFCYCGRTGKMPVPQKILLLWKNRQDACSTKNFLLLWNGHLARSIFFGNFTKKL